MVAGCLLACSATADVTAPAAVPITPAAVTGAPASALPLQLTPEALSKDKKPVEVNLARWFFGATLIQQQKDGSLKQIILADMASDQYSDLLTEDITTSVKLDAGETKVVIDIGGSTTVRRLGFFSFSAEGSVELYYSNAASMVKSLDTTSPDWSSANVQKDFAARDAVDLQLKPVDARYVMIIFHLKQAGEIGTLGLYGDTLLPGASNVAPDQDLRDANGKVKVVNPNDLIEFDYANLAFGSKVTHVSGGNVDQAQNILASDPSKNLQLGGAKEDAQNHDNKLANVFVVDMGKEHKINKVGLLFATSGPGKFDFYFLNALPTENAAAQPTAALNLARSARPVLLAASAGSFAEALVLSQAGDSGVQNIQYLPDNFFQQNKPVISQNVTSDSSRVAQNFDNNLSFRYALIHWIPDSPNQPPIEILRVNLIGKVPIENFVDASKKGTAAAGLPSFATITPPDVTPVSNQPTGTGTGTSPGSGTGGGGGGGGGGGNPPEPPPTPTPPNPVSP